MKAFRRLLEGGGPLHILGIGGMGMSGVALILHERGVPVSGCDQRDSPLLRSLAQEGIAVAVGHDAAHLSGMAALLATSAASEEHPEVQAARHRGLPVFRRREVLGPLVEPKRLLAVAGTHGKTTTSALLAFVLEQAGRGPGFLIGGQVPFWRHHARWGRGGEFVLEADEYDRTFLGLRPSLAIITNVEHDHVDCYPTEVDFQEAFAAFAEGVGDFLLLPAEDGATPRLREATRACVETWGRTEEADWRLEAVRLGPERSEAGVFHRGKLVGQLRLSLMGEHNLLNALAVFAAAWNLGVPREVIQEACAAFEGVARRLQVRGTYGGALLVDDYAHHPTEVRATLRAARQRFPGRRLVVVFQPHTFSRWRRFLREFATALGEADYVLLTDIYAAREADPGDISPRDALPWLPRGKAEASGSLEETAERLRTLAQEGDVILVLGAGDCTRLADILLGLRGRG